TVQNGRVNEGSPYVSSYLNTCRHRKRSGKLPSGNARRRQRTGSWEWSGRCAQERSRALDSSNLNLGAIICLADRERKQTESISGQNRITRCEMIEPDPSIPNPNHTRRHVVGDVGLCPELCPLIVNLDPITVGQLTCICGDPGYPELRCSVMFCQRWQG